MYPSKEELVDLYLHQKLTIKEIADKVKISKYKVFSLLKEYNINIKNPRAKISPKKEILSDLYNKMTTSQIGKKYNVNRATVFEWLKQYNIPLRNPYDKLQAPPKEELVNLHINLKKTLTEIAFIYDVNYNIVSKWFKQYDIKINKYNISEVKPEKDKLYNLYQNKLTIQQIADIYQVDKKTVNNWFKSYNIEVNSNIRKFYHLKAVPFTEIQKQFIVGTLLGNGHIARIGKKSRRLTITHCEKQLDYLLWKKDIMSNFVNNIRKNEKTSKNSIFWSFASITHNEFNFYHNLFYENNKKVIKENIADYLTNFGLAVWLMDSGFKSNNVNIRLSTELFSENENEILKRIIKLNFDLNCKVCTYVKNNIKYHYLSFNKRNSILLSKIVDKYIIPSMKYKLVLEEIPEHLSRE